MPEPTRNELGVADLGREPDQRGRNLRVEDRQWHASGRQVQHLEVLACGVHHLDPAWLGQQLEQPCEIEPVERVDEHAVRIGRDLHETQLGVVRALAHELGVKRETRRAAHAKHRRGELIGGSNERGIAH